MTEPLRYMRLSYNAIPPFRASPEAAGYDLFSAYDVVVPPHGRALVKTDLAFRFPRGCYGRVAARSGLACKFKIDVGAGVIDPDYRGNVGVLVLNFSDHEFNISKGDRIAQLILEKITTPPLECVDQLDATVRGEDGFGSTGGHSDLK